MRFSAPTHAPDIICIGTNYRASMLSVESPPLPDHTLEVFLKLSSALIGDGEPIPMPRFDGIDVRLDCEGELAIVIGRDARDISEHEALDVIRGCTIANDLTARHFQTPTGPPLWMRGKGFPGFCPIGPHVVSTDDLGDLNALRIRTLINGRVIRDGSTAQMMRGVPQIIAALSRHMTLRKGSIILTGAPPVADAPAAPTGLKSGDELEVEIDGLGRLCNRVA